MSMTPLDNQVAVELASLRGVMETGFASVAGQLNGIDHRTKTTEQDIKVLEVRVGALERRYWMVVGGCGVLAIGCSGLLTSILVH